LIRYLTIARRRKSIIIACLLLVPASAFAFSKRQEAKYRDSAEVLLNRTNLGTSLAGVQDPYSSLDAERSAKTQAQIAAVPDVAARVLRDVGVRTMTPRQLLANTEVIPSKTTDVLVFQVTGTDVALVTRLANSWARTYVKFRTEVDAARFRRARVEVENRLESLRAEGETDGGFYRQLASRAQQLRTLETLQTGNATIVRAADGVAQTQPNTRRNVFFGGILGLLLGAALAFLWESIDTRLRTADEISEELDLSLLGRVTEPPAQVRKNDELVMLADPHSVQAEAFRLLRTNVQFANLHRSAKTVMVTSAVQGEGKSTTIANLAVSAAQAGQNVVLVDLDLRRPVLHRFFDQPRALGVTNVALGYASLDEAIIRVDVASSPLLQTDEDDGAERGPHLDVLLSGPLPPNPGDFIQSDQLGTILATLRERYDTVFIDAPPVLNVGDAVSFSARVDGILVAVRLGTANRSMLRELRRLLDGSPAAVLGFVLTGAERDESVYGSGYYEYAYSAPPSSKKSEVGSTT
jgi:succinoglycan biosynthesis transport protein ExoP